MLADLSQLRRGLAAKGSDAELPGLGEKYRTRPAGELVDAGGTGPCYVRSVHVLTLQSMRVRVHDDRSGSRRCSTTQRTKGRTLEVIHSGVYKC
jgi:hypothetical protein